MTTDAPTTLILRFRDLVTARGDTIANHTAIIQASGSVWWGWWNKSGERVPDDAFRALNLSAKGAEGLRLLLLDSGRELVFEATCREISWNRDHERIRSPDPALTPSYYSEQLYYAWFRLEGIRNADETSLQEFTYVRVDGFFENGTSRYAPFYGKRVSNAHELRQQDRTIWFIRPFNEGTDLTHELLLLNSKQLTPTTYEAEFANSKSFNLLWVSDLHFSKEHHAFPTEPTPSTRDLGQAIENGAGQHKIFDFAGILVSGDITWSADPTEFEQALGFFRRIATSPSKLDNYRLAIVPGNHDLRFTPTPADNAAAVNDTVAPEVAREAFSALYRKLFYLNPNEYLSSGRKFLLGGCVPVEVACLNSSLIEQKKGWYQGHGFIGEDQLRHVASGMGWTLPPPEVRPFRIVMLHHHLMPVTYRETPMGGAASSVVFDAEAVVQWLVSHRVNLVLHGHMHKEFCARVSRPINARPEMDTLWHTFDVIGMGSSGVASHHRTSDNTFGVLQFHHMRPRISVFSVHPTEPSQLLWEMQLEHEIRK